MATGNRASNLAAHSETYTAATAIPEGSYILTGSFYAGANESGVVVATVSVPVTLSTGGVLQNSSGGSLGSVAFVGVVKSVAITANQSLTTGQTLQLVVTAYDANSNPVAVTPGSFNFSLINGNSYVSITPDGIATAIAAGTASVTASIDGVTSSPATVSVSSPGHALRFSRTTDSIQLAGGTLNGACPLGNQFTIEAIVRPTSNSGQIWQQWAEAEMDQRFGISGSALQAVAFDTFFTGNSTLPLNQWSHIAWCYNGSQFLLYVNGNLAFTITSLQGATRTTSGQACALGFSNADYAVGSNLSFLGDIAGFRISNTVRYTGSSYAPPTLPLTSDNSTLMLVDPYSSTTTPNSFTAPGLQGVTATLGAGGGSATSPSWVPYTP